MPIATLGRRVGKDYTKDRYTPVLPTQPPNLYLAGSRTALQVCVCDDHERLLYNDRLPLYTDRLLQRTTNCKCPLPPLRRRARRLEDWS